MAEFGIFSDDARAYQVSIGYKDRARADEERDKLAALPQTGGGVAHEV